MRIAVLGAGPAGLYCALLLKKADPAHTITVYERNAPDATYGWGVVFSDRTLAAFQEADHKTYRAISDHFVLWDAIDTYYHGELVRCGGHVFAGLARKQLLAILQARCIELGVSLKFHAEVSDLAELGEPDLIIAADGVNSLARRVHAATLTPSITYGKARYIWLGTDKVLDAFTFIFRANEAGLFQVHSYPFDGTTSTFIVECAEDVWQRAGLEEASEAESVAYCERLFAPELAGQRLLPNNSKWISFPTLTCASWHVGNVVLLGDAAHTAHFSIGSGTKLAMEDAIALANAIEQYPDLERALAEYEMERKPVVELFQAAAAESQTYFESVKRYASLPPLQFTFNLLTRSGRVSYDDLRLRDPRIGMAVDRDFASRNQQAAELAAPPPTFVPFHTGSRGLENRIVTALPAGLLSEDGMHSEAGLALTAPVAISADGRISPACAGIYTGGQRSAWSSLITSVHRTSGARLGIVLNHAGRRGAVRPSQEAHGLDRPLREGAWSLLAPSPLSYTPRSQTPKEMDGDDMARVRDDFVSAAQAADAAGFDLLMLHMGHGYLLSSFLSPLTNVRADDYGGALANRLRYPLAVFDAVRAVWPREKPLAVALSVTDSARGGLAITEGVAIARALQEHGCDLIQVMAGYTVPELEMPYKRGFLTPLSDRVRNEVGIPTLVDGYLTTTNEINTILAGGRADLCVLTPVYAPVRVKVPAASDTEAHEAGGEIPESEVTP